MKGGGHVAQIYAIRQAISKALVSYYQKCKYNHKTMFVIILNVVAFETSTRNHETCSSNMIEPHQDYSGRRHGSLLLQPNKDNI